MGPFTSLILHDNWQAFEALNQRAGHQPLLVIP